VKTTIVMTMKLYTSTLSKFRYQ